ncbi:MAG: ABC transporter ATP-binding protein [Dehalococcoidia bacterium]|jgi:oligopeptide/dipeptide ABC transporter ATP-binding protein|nr:ABC transporter ATP-binding protein [Dehalococcoidia bacterium]
MATPKDSSAKSQEKEEVLRIEDLHTYFYSREGVVKAANGVNLSVKAASILGIVGESGSGKSVTALSLLRLIPYPGEIVQGAVYFDDKNLLEIDTEEMLKIRGGSISMIFQDPKGSLNPIETIGKQISEILLAHSPMSIMEATKRTMELLRELSLPENVFRQYPFQLSGGQAQRAMIAMATAWRPKILIADEPTSNLDMTTQADVLIRLQRIRAEHHTAVILITHNMGVIAQMAEEIAVIYGGAVVEYGETEALFERPHHPYTWGLLQSITRLDKPDQALHPIPGFPVDPIDLPDQCPYMPRCPKASNECRLSVRPSLREIEQGHYVACYNVIEQA